MVMGYLFEQIGAIEKVLVLHDFLSGVGRAG
jgi:hypothetical protein